MIRRVVKAVRNVWNLGRIMSRSSVDIGSDGFEFRYGGVLRVELRGEDLTIEVKGITRRVAEYYLYNCPEGFNPREGVTLEDSLDYVKQTMQERVYR